MTHFFTKILAPIVIIVLVLTACSNSDNEKKDMEVNFFPFEFVVIDSDFSAASSLVYILSDKKLEIISHSGLEGGMDSVLLKTDLKSSDTLKMLSAINLDSLKELYENPCIMDGLQMTVYLQKGGKKKAVHLSNYYQKDIGLAIELINSLVPKEFKIWYDKKELVEGLERCK